MSHDTYADDFSQAGGRLLGAARRNPEALLLLAAGCCLLMRSGGSVFKRTSQVRYDDTGHAHRADFRRASPGPASSSVREGLSRAADAAGDYASDIKDRVSDAASSYTEAAADFAQDAGRSVSEHTSRLTRQAQSTLESGMARGSPGLCAPPGRMGLLKRFLGFRTRQTPMIGLPTNFRSGSKNSTKRARAVKRGA